MSAIVMHPRAVELVERRKLREKVERAVSRLIAILDGLDSDPEAEPALGAPDRSTHWGQGSWAQGAPDGREQDAGDEPEVEDEHRDTADMEPSLGAAEGCEDQRRWTAGNRRDLEGDGSADGSWL